MNHWTHYKSAHKHEQMVREQALLEGAKVGIAIAAEFLEQLGDREQADKLRRADLVRKEAGE